MFKNILTNTLLNKNFYYFLIGISIVFSTIYFRLIRIRLPRELLMLQDNVIKYSIVFMVSVGFAINLYLLILNILTLYSYKPKENRFTHYVNQISETIRRSLFVIYNIIVTHASDSYDKLANLADKFYNYFSTTPETFFPFLKYFVRLLIVLAFLVDVFFFFKLNFFYKALYLLIINILIEILFYILIDFAKNVEDAANALIITPKGVNPDSGLPITNYERAPGYENINLQFYITQYILCNKLTGYLDYYQRYANFFNPRVAIVIHSLYLIGWIYVLYQNLI